VSRRPAAPETNAWSRARAERGAVPYDLTLSNPTAADLPYPSDLLQPLADPRALRYEPDPAGLAGAREAVAATLGDGIDADRLLLTASTSEAYGLLFKLLAEPGEAIAVPQPSYPLFEHLVALEGLRVLPYELDADDDWQPRLDDLPGDTRAVVAVHPNNPTGSLLRAEAWRSLDALAKRGCPPVVDEVFLDYPLTGATPTGARRNLRGPAFALGGLSKSVGLPQLKLAWIAVLGPSREAAALRERLELIADQYLSVATPVQHALPELLERGRPVRAAIRARCRENLQALAELAAGSPLTPRLPEAGWSVPLRIPAHVDEERFCVARMREDGVAIYPGYFFDFPAPGWLVASLLTPPDAFGTGMRIVRERLEREEG
jgi:aspartate/methionine/tyrosine aminotransferase